MKKEEAELKHVTEKMKNLRTEAIVLSLKAIGFMLNQDPRGRNEMFLAAAERIEQLDLSLDKMVLLLDQKDPEDDYGQELRDYLHSNT
jgi:hypothetical protein